MRIKTTAFLLLTGGLLVPIGNVQGATPDRPTIACTIPVLEVLAREVGGDDFEYFTLSKPDQDPHYVRATPVLQRKLRQADLFIEVGLQLELWADLVANKAGRPRLQRGQAGRVVASLGIPREQIPSTLTRAAGHIHPDGNPHIWLDPLRGVRMAENVARALKRLDPEKAGAVDRRLAEFRSRIYHAVFGKELTELLGPKDLERRVLDKTLHRYLREEELEGTKLIEHAGGWIRKAAALHGRNVIEFHQDWIYLANLLGLEIVGTIEEKPGIPPGARHLLELTARLKRGGISFILVDNFYSPRTPNTLSRDTGVPTVIVPNQPGGEPGTETYVAFFDHLIDRMLGAIKR